MGFDGGPDPLPLSPAFRGQAEPGGEPLLAPEPLFQLVVSPSRLSIGPFAIQQAGRLSLVFCSDATRSPSSPCNPYDPPVDRPAPGTLHRLPIVQVADINPRATYITRGTIAFHRYNITFSVLVPLGRPGVARVVVVDRDPPSAKHCLGSSFHPALAGTLDTYGTYSVLVTLMLLLIRSMSRRSTCEGSDLRVSALMCVSFPGTNSAIGY